jgi:hypothetical protein
MPLRVQINDEPDGTGAAAWAADCIIVVLWGKPLLYGVGPSLFRGCDCWSVECQLLFAFLAPLYISSSSKSSRRSVSALRLQLVNPTNDNVALSLPVS